MYVDGGRMLRHPSRLSGYGFVWPSSGPFGRKRHAGIMTGSPCLRTNTGHGCWMGVPNQAKGLRRICRSGKLGHALIRRLPSPSSRFQFAVMGRISRPLAGWCPWDGGPEATEAAQLEGERYGLLPLFGPRWLRWLRWLPWLPWLPLLPWLTPSLFCANPLAIMHGPAAQEEAKGQVRRRVCAELSCGWDGRGRPRGGWLKLDANSG